MHDDLDTDPLADVLDHLEQYDHAGALEALRLIDRDSLVGDDRGRATAMEVVCLDWEGEAKQAADLLQNTVKQEFSDESFMVGLGLQFSDLDEFDAAEQVLKILCDSHPDSAEARHHLACTLVDADKKEDALVRFDEAIACDPKFADAHCGKAWCLQELGRLPEAAQAYRKYLAIQPDEAYEWVSLGVVESEQGHYEAATQAYESALALEPELNALHYNWLITAFRQGDVEKAMECVERLEELAPDDWRTAMGRAHVAEMQGQIWQAWEACQEAIESAKQDGQDFEEAHDAALAALQFIVRNDMQDEAESIVEEILNAGLFSEKIFSAVRRLHGKHSAKAFEYLVLVGGTVSDDDLDEAPPPHISGRNEKGITYGRSYVVYAESPDEAKNTALQFESRYVGGIDLHVDGIEQRNGPVEADLGIVDTLPSRTIFRPEDK